ncbi:MAG: thioredoxin [Sphingobacteriia bacterium]|jgi:thioredoxin 1|nr:thioredoxin [Paludibacteraceae bacterium]NCA80354.1 thioredoxin [Sphingobacteriia bacterium]
MAEKITDSNLKEIIANNALVVVDFGATWCGPCRMMAPIIDELAEAYAGKVFIGKADVEECADATEFYAIRSVPTILFFKNGELLPDKFVGATQKKTLEDKINSLM